MVAYFLLRTKPKSAEEVERERRAWLDQSGRITDGTVIDVQEITHDDRPTTLLIYQYDVAGVSYECSQDVTYLRPRINLHSLPSRPAHLCSLRPPEPRQFHCRFGTLDGTAAVSQASGELLGPILLGKTRIFFPDLTPGTWIFLAPEACFLRASRCETAGVGHGEPQVLVRIDWSVVDADFVVKVGAGAATAESDVTDGISAVHMLGRNDCEVGQVTIAGADAMAVVEDHSAPIATHKVCKHDHAIRWGDHRLPIGRTDIHTAVESTFPVKRVNAFPKGAGHRAFHRPQVRGGVGAGPSPPW